MIPKSFVQDLLARVDILDVISKYVRLRKAGSNFVGLCPFHNERTPSFTVNRVKKNYHCFGCGVHGDSISFLMSHLGLSFTESVKSLALQIGLVVPMLDNKELQNEYKKEKIYLDIMFKTQSYYSHLLYSSVAAISYLKKRGISNDFIKFFNLGWSDTRYNSLSKIFSDYYNNIYLIDVGLVIKKSNENRYDRFRERIIFPIKNQYGSVVGFGARTISNTQPKYLNSPETVIFSKGRELYGLWESRINIKSKGVVLVVEGYMDVISLTQHGVNNVVATLGTSITKEQIKKLLNISDKIVFSFDGDAAGKNAAWKALLLCISEINDSNEIRFLFLKDGYDPDLYIKENGKDIFENCLKKSVPLSKMLIENYINKYSINEAEGRAACWTDISKTLKQMQHCSALRIQIEKEIAEILNFNKNDLTHFLLENNNLFSNKKWPTARHSNIQNRYLSNKKSVPSLMRRLFNLLLSNLTLVNHIGDQQLEILDKDSDLKIIRDLVLLVENTNTKDLDSIKKIVDPYSELGMAISNFTEEDLIDKNKLPDPLKEWEDSLLLIESQSIKNDMIILAKNGLSSREDIDRYKDLSKRMISIKAINKS
ncbi:DNA primase dnaG [Candidatus Kinetoplastibacterium blastocrithidii TCC012E]|uniref:DNA primase n=1 Tax=Candidatus Kinetoplastidibacterium blastocrithidiae TCC012E TaxID=1208922 RepID=M1MDL1_9PROT|nr:DNA primase [Candidatus Kinetoplastibacterium blastocrithidii]AFZ83688.1 DNA primase [Candidatus Kinetoplastibacterium blastocrithidii (ex Strigomonas culicis)]AGF49810.1 DNA primase dnaG [Candidatus Kinetoplastibacterium blastocrithidii TCC012E]